MSEMFAFHATMMSNTLGTSILVFTRTGFMAMLLSHYRPAGTVFAFTNDKRVQSRLALYHSVRALYMPFSDDAEETFCKALAILQVHISLLLQLCDNLIKDLQLFKCILQLQHSLCLGQELKCSGLSDDFSSDR
jgi:hypothetical protein